MTFTALSPVADSFDEMRGEKMMSIIKLIELYKSLEGIMWGSNSASLKHLSRLAVVVLAFACRCSAQYQLETNYAEPNVAHDREYLFGNMFGLRSRLSEKGITFNIENTTDSFGVVHGGLSNQPAAFTRIRGTIDIDLDKLSNTHRHLSFHATGLWQSGTNIGAKLGSYANPSGLDSVHVFRMDSYWVQEQFANGIVTLRFGQMAGWDFFGNQEYGASYTIEPLNYALGNIFSNTYLTFNPAGVPAFYIRLDGFRAKDRPIHGVYVKSGVFSGNRNPYQQDPTGLHFVLANSAVIASEAGYLWDAPVSPDQMLPTDRKLYPGIYRFGGIVNPNGVFTDPLTNMIDKGSYLYYFMAAQAVYRAEAGSNRGLDFTFAYDNSPNNVNQQNSMITAGAVYHGIIRRRTVDDLTFGFVSTRTGNAYSQLNEELLGFPLGWEKAYTLDYRAQIKPWLVAQPTIQYFNTIAGDPHRTSGLVLGLRTDVRF
jgi:porin